MKLCGILIPSMITNKLPIIKYLFMDIKKLTENIYMQHVMHFAR